MTKLKHRIRRVNLRFYEIQVIGMRNDVLGVYAAKTWDELGPKTRGIVTALATPEFDNWTVNLQMGRQCWIEWDYDLVQPNAAAPY